jgi:hypothetical protein
VSLPINVGGVLYNGVIKKKGSLMRDTMNEYVFTTNDGKTFEMKSEQDQSEWFIDNYYSGRISRLWINGVEFEEPTD